MVLNLYVHAAFQVDLVCPSIYSNFMNHLMIHDSGILETRQFSTFRCAKPTFCLLSRLKRYLLRYTFTCTFTAIINTIYGKPFKVAVLDYRV